jgi:hypothetical protein
MEAAASLLQDAGSRLSKSVPRGRSSSPPDLHLSTSPEIEGLALKMACPGGGKLRLAAKERGVTKAALVREALTFVGVPMAA